jgi:hypothetical protein
LGFVGYPPYPGKRPVLGPSGPPSPGGPVLGCFGVPWGGPKVPCFGTRGTYREVSTDIIWHPPRGGPGRPWGRPWEALGGPWEALPPYPPIPLFWDPPLPPGYPKTRGRSETPPYPGYPYPGPPYPGPGGRVPRTQGGYPGPRGGTQGLPRGGTWGLLGGPLVAPLG